MKLLPLFLLISFLSFGQVSQKVYDDIDSVSFYLESNNRSLKKKYLKRAMLLSKKLNNDSLLKKASIQYGLECYFKKDTFGILQACKNLEFLHLRNEDSLSLAKIYHFKALKHRIQNRLDSSYYYYNKSKNVSILLKDSLEVGRRLLSMGYMQNDEKDYLGGESTIVEALEFLEPLNEIVYRGDCYNILGNILVNKKEYKQGREFYNRAQKVFDKSDSETFKERWNLHILNNLGNSYLVQSNYKQALIFLNQGLSKSGVSDNYRDIYKLLLGNAAACKYNLGKKAEAWKDLNKLMEMRKAEDGPFRQSIVHNNFAYYLLKEGKEKEALKFTKESYELAKQGNNNQILLTSLERLISLTPMLESKKYFSEYKELRDYLEKREAGLKDQFALVRYETEEKEKENEALRIERDRRKLQNQIFGLLVIAAFLALILSYNFFRARRKKLMYEAQLQKATAREEERQQIAKSLHDEVAGDLRMLHQKLAKTELQGEAKSVEKIKDNVRNLSHQLSSVSFDEVSFKDQIINLITDNFDLDFRIKAEGIDTVAWEEVNNTIKRTLYLSIRESMQNTLKYAEANKFFIQFSSEKKEILLLLKDNGKGFEKGKGKKGIGLKNLKERVEEIQGTFEINSSEQGTQTTITIPINGR